MADTPTPNTPDSAKMDEARQRMEEQLKELRKTPGGNVIADKLEATMKAQQAAAASNPDNAAQAWQKLMQQTHNPTAAQSNAASEPADPARDEGVKKIADKIREKAKQDGNYAPQGDAAYDTMAKEIYKNPQLRKMYLGSEEEQAETARTLNQQQQQNVAGQMHQLSGQEKQQAAGAKPGPDDHGVAAADAQSRIMGSMASTVDGTSPGLKPSPDSGGSVPIPPNFNGPTAVSGDDIKARGHAAEHALADIIRAHQKDNPTHIVDFPKMAIGNRELQETMQAYQKWEEMNAKSRNPEPPSEDRALIRMDRLAAFINNKTVDAGNGQLYVPNPADRAAFEALERMAAETHKTPQDFGMVIQPPQKTGPSR